MGEVKSGSESTIEDIDSLLPTEWVMLDERARSLELRRLRHDAQLQRLAVQSWREYLERSTVSREKLEEALDRDDLKPGDLWAPGLTETLSVASTPDDVRRYRKKLEFRAQVLSSVLEETLAELERSAKWEPFADAGDEKAEKNYRASP